MYPRVLSCTGTDRVAACSHSARAVQCRSHLDDSNHTDTKRSRRMPRRQLMASIPALLSVSHCQVLPSLGFFQSSHPVYARVSLTQRMECRVL